MEAREAALTGQLERLLLKRIQKIYFLTLRRHIFFSSLNLNTSCAPKRELVSVLAGLRQLNVEKIRFLDN